MKALWNALRRRNKWKSISRAALLKDNAPDSEPLRHWFESTVEQQFLLTAIYKE